MSYKLSYFDIRGLAEMVRLMLTDNSIPFEDHRIARDDWAALKPTFHFGQVPCLFDDDEQICQTGSIVRHIARKHNLYGSSNSEATFIDMFFEGVRDLHSKYTRIIYQAYDEKDKFIADVLPDELEKLERLLKTYNGGEKYVAGDKVSFADYALFEELDVMLILSPEALDNFPTLKAFHERFTNRPSLRLYLDKRAASGVNVNGNGKQ